ncbi:hypothetical protein RSSM_05696 [Rhodopirellula sallentina SM41]|uniref:Uncharacterized protein n=1 Tax=Rhodopirellula sallentina SM41 TaxID=1263870 RepID=M5TUL2_9BACT|nr:hypothetical protein RSSM_05696 [Rhodopirellula sallentina SM41]
MGWARIVVVSEPVYLFRCVIRGPATLRELSKVRAMLLGSITLYQLLFLGFRHVSLFSQGWLWRDGSEAAIPFDKLSRS